MDCLHVQQIRAFGYVGALPEEQVLGQWFEVNLSLWMDLHTAGQSDRLSDTHDYRASIELVQALIRTSRFKLVESLAEAIALGILKLGGIQQVRVQLRKTPPIPNFDGAIVIDITRALAAELLPAPSEP